MNQKLTNKKVIILEIDGKLKDEIEHAVAVENSKNPEWRLTRAGWMRLALLEKLGIVTRSDLPQANNLTNN